MLHSMRIRSALKKGFSHFQHGLFCHAYFADAIQKTNDV